MDRVADVTTPAAPWMARIAPAARSPHDEEGDAYRDCGTPADIGSGCRFADIGAGCRFADIGSGCRFADIGAAHSGVVDDMARARRPRIDRGQRRNGWPLTTNLA